MLYTIMMTGVYRNQVLSLYKQILCLGRTWTSASGISKETNEERAYIKNEAHILFKKNKNETCEEKVKEYIREAETRIGLDEFSTKILLPKGKSKLKVDQKILHQATPIYLKSYEDKT